MTPINEQTIIVTGANSGIGKVTARELARMGAQVILACRNAERGNAALEMIKQETGNEKVHLLLVDLSSQASIEAFSAEFRNRFDRLDVLVNNAGGYFRERHETVDGLELTFGLNHMGYFLLTTALLDLLKQSAPARIVNVSSGAHQMGSFDFDDYNREGKYRGFPAYGQSKLANILFTYELARRLEGTGVTVNALHPGFVATNFSKNNGVLAKVAMTLMRPFALSEDKGAETSIYLASSPEVEGVTGSYFEEKKAIKSSAASYDEEAQRRLWQLSEQLAAKQASSPASQAPSAAAQTSSATA